MGRGGIGKKKIEKHMKNKGWVRIWTTFFLEKLRFIPIFVPWVDLAVKNKGYPGGLVKSLGGNSNIFGDFHP